MSGLGAAQPLVDCKLTVEHARQKDPKLANSPAEIVN